MATAAATATATVPSFHQRFTQWACEPSLYHCENAPRVARFSLIDTLACMLIGADERQSLVMAQALEESGDEGSIRPMGGGQPRSLYGAAMLNGTRAHAIDFDDYEIPGSTHVSAPIFSALLALAQRREMTVDAFGACWIVGFEAIVRIGAALGTAVRVMVFQRRRPRKDASSERPIWTDRAGVDASDARLRRGQRPDRGNPSLVVATVSARRRAQ